MRKSPYFALIGLSLAIVARSTSADTVKEVAQEIRADSVLPLHQNVASFWANNLPRSAGPQRVLVLRERIGLAAVIEAVLRAITIEADPVYGAGFTFCNLTNCIIANAQSIIAINSNAHVMLTPTSLDFGDVPVQTPEPEVWILTLMGLTILTLWTRFIRSGKLFYLGGLSGF